MRSAEGMTTALLRNLGDHLIHLLNILHFQILRLLLKCFEHRAFWVVEIDYLVIVLDEEEVEQEAHHHVLSWLTAQLVGFGLADDAVLQNFKFLLLFELSVIFQVVSLDQFVIVVEVAGEDGRTTIEGL